MVCGNFILPEPASYVFFYAVFNLRNLLYIIALVSTVLFANDSTVIHDRLPLGEVPPLTEKEYFTCGCTALLDAVGGAIHHIGNIHKYARREDVPEKTMFIITTDGYENASRRYDYEMVRRKLCARSCGMCCGYQKEVPQCMTT